MQQGHQPSPKDRVLATDLALEAANLVDATLKRGEKGWVGAVGIVDDAFVHTPLSALLGTRHLTPHLRCTDAAQSRWT